METASVAIYGAYLRGSVIIQPPPQQSSLAKIMTSTETPRQRALALMDRRDQLEAEIRDQQTILAQHTSTMNSPLIDSEGFPRADIDVYAVRHARVRIIELTNDVKSVMEDIRMALEDVHRTQDFETTTDLPSSSLEPSQLQRSNQTGAANGTAHVNGTSSSDRPFARVDGVAPGSPANEAGLLREDLILQFGTLTADAFQNGSLQPLSSYVAQHENQRVPLRIRRSNQTAPSAPASTHDRELMLVPRVWNGRGLLGFHIVPVS